ncbi:hypothetical protein CHUAL_008867 [Chamberlinius hualienensis]
MQKVIVWASAALTPLVEATAKVSVARNGPLFAPIDGRQKSFIFYKEGIYSDNNCKTRMDEMNYVVVIVGYGTDKTTGREYWILKNSWGTNWGEDGYMRLARNENNQCGIANCPIYIFG